MFLELRWITELIKDSTKILSMRVENLNFVDSLNFLPMSLKSRPKSFDLTCKKGHYPHFFNTAKNLDYVGPHPEPKFYELLTRAGTEITNLIFPKEEVAWVSCNHSDENIVTGKTSMFQLLHT
jgi:hypothetical protein